MQGEREEDIFDILMRTFPSHLPASAGPRPGSDAEPEHGCLFDSLGVTEQFNDDEFFLQYHLEGEGDQFQSIEDEPTTRSLAYDEDWLDDYGQDEQHEDFDDEQPPVEDDED